MIPAERAYEIAVSAAHLREKEEKELKEIEELINERARVGEFCLIINKQLSTSTIKTLKNFNYNVSINCLHDYSGFVSGYETRIIWYAD